MCRQLRQVPLAHSPEPVPDSAVAFVQEGLRRAKAIDCFDFVPSDFLSLYAILANIPRGRFCEWGSGMGIGVGLAASLGFEAHGIEIDPALATASRSLLTDFGLSATVTTGSYFDEHLAADVYFTYCWPSQMMKVEEHFLKVAPQESRLLICHGAEDIRCKTKDL
jgi:hypothetical protein